MVGRDEYRTILDRQRHVSRHHRFLPLLLRPQDQLMASGKK